MLKLSSIIFIFLLSATAIAQKKQNVYFLKYDGKYVKVRDSADFIRIVQEPDSGSVLYNVLDFYKEGQRKLIGKSSKIDPVVLEGSCMTLYKSGKKESLTTYYKGTAIDAAYNFHTNGKLFLMRQFADTADKNKYANITYNCLLMEARDSSGNVLVNNGNGYYKGVFDDIDEQGTVKDGKMVGEWKGREKDSKINFVETYENGILISGVATDSTGASQTYTKLRQKVPEFKGGIEAFYKYLSATINYPFDARENYIQGTVVLGFVVEKDGAVSDIKVNKSVSRSIDWEAVRVIKKSPHWVPATRFGRVVRCSYAIPLSFALSN